MSAATADQLADLVIGGPHPILDALLLGEPEGSHVLDLFAPADEFERAQFAVARVAPAALEPDAVHDPPRPIRARVISSTPTGSLMLAMGPGRSIDFGDLLARHDEAKYLARLESQDA